MIASKWREERATWESVVIRKMLGCLALCLAGAFATANAGEIYKVDLSVTRNGLLVGKPSIQVVAGKDADLTITPAGATKEEAVRVIVSVAPAAEAKTVGVHAMIFDRVNGEWALRSEPEIQTKLDKDVSLTVGTSGLARVASPIELSLKVSPATVTSETSATMSRAPSGLDIATAPASCNCCTAGNLQCCNVVSCCDNNTGNCCSPPCHRVEAERNLTQTEVERRRDVTSPMLLSSTWFALATGRPYEPRRFHTLLT